VMLVWRTIAGWQERRRALAGRKIGFVPTMGALHQGHASLVERCRRENEIAVVSIFVNPSQFNDPSDLGRYPRTLDEMYPDGYRFRVEPGDLDRVLEDVYRPGHLAGVLTIVLKLFGLVGADRAYFGEKDYQQLRIVSDMAREFFLATQIVACPTMREESGLAMSSRNMLLPPECRDRASQLYRVLTTSTGSAEAKQELEAQGFTVEYVEERWGRRLAAAYLNGVRLIDNVPVTDIRVV
jgi:pantoate--beta-alanine ligase